jgi:hypothetical protein
MLTKLKHILNTYTDKELEDMELWVNSSFQISKIVIDEDSINLFQEDSDITIKTWNDDNLIVCKEES